MASYALTSAKRAAEVMVLMLAPFANPKGVEQWMLENRKQINMKLIILYNKIGGPVPESSEDEGLVKKKVHTFVCS